jgi:5-formyltetrahydrofolate cyclo-ligase
MYNHVMPDDLPDLKKKMRKHCVEIRKSLSSDFRRNASLEICQHIKNGEKFQEAGVIFTYMPMNDEVDLYPLLDEFPQKEWVIPRIQPHSRMILHTYDPGKLIRHRFGMLEPDPSQPEISPSQVDLVLVPGLAYDRQGWRLGYGGGFYDKFLAGIPGLATLGITYQALVLDNIPHDDHDIPVQALVTEDGIMETNMEHKN